MKLINESVWKFDSVKYGAYMALFLSCLQLVIQEVYNANILPEPYPVSYTHLTLPTNREV